MEKLFLKRNLLIALKKAGLPCSYPFLIKMEKLGVIKKPNSINVDGDLWRIYNARQIEEVVKRIKRHYK